MENPQLPGNQFAVGGAGAGGNRENGGGRRPGKLELKIGDHIITIIVDVILDYFRARFLAHNMVYLVSVLYILCLFLCGLGLYSSLCS